MDPLTQQLAQQKLAQQPQDPMDQLLSLYQQTPQVAPPTPEQEQQRRLSLAMMITGQGDRNRGVGQVGQMMYDSYSDERDRTRKQSADNLNAQRGLAGQMVGWQREDDRNMVKDERYDQEWARDAQQYRDEYDEGVRRYDTTEQRLRDTTKPPSGAWRTIADPVNGGFLQHNQQTGETRRIGGAQELAASGKPGFNVPGGVSLGLTETQDKSRFYATNMAQSVPAMDALVNAGYMPSYGDIAAAGPPATGPLGAIQNITPRGSASPEGRQFYTAARQALAGILRKESGAAITDDEWTNYGPMYIPWGGDTPQEVAAKMELLYAMSDSMAAGAGPAYRYWVSPRQEAQGGQTQQSQDADAAAQYLNDPRSLAGGVD